VLARAFSDTKQCIKSKHQLQSLLSSAELGGPYRLSARSDRQKQQLVQAQEPLCSLRPW
jgi:hypothetical protein